MDAVSAKPVFSGDPLGTEEPQRPFRVSGLLALLLGLVSFSALFNIGLLFIPAIAVLCALLALRPTRDPNVRPAGRTVAVIGATLALFFGGWSVAQHTTQNHHLVGEGERVARNWLAVLASGQTELAYELTLPARSRQFETMPLDEYYSNEPQSRPFEEFKESGVVRTVLEMGDQIQWDFVGAVTRWRRFGSDNVMLRFEDSSGRIEKPLDIAVERTPVGADVAEWRVSDYGFLD